MRKILLVEDDPSLGFVIKDNLSMKGYDVTLCRDGEEADRVFAPTAFHLCIFDVMLPRKDGFTLARSVRARDKSIPILFLTAKSMTEDKLEGFSIGADDYITKPFSPRELQARVNAMFRRPRAVRTSTDVAPSGSNGSAPTAATTPAPPPAGEPDAALLTHGRIAVDAEGRVVTVDGREAELTRTEFDLLTTLLSAPRRVWSRAVLLDSLWGPGWSEEHLVEVHVGNLRRKLARLGPAGGRAPIRTVRGVGYRMEEPDAF